MNELRPAIIRAHENGKRVREIARFLDIEPSTVSRTIKRFEETGSNERILSHGPTMLLATMSGLFNRTEPQAQSNRDPKFHSCELPWFHIGRYPLAQQRRWMAAKLTRFERSGLLCVKHSRRKSVCETPPECRILEASFEEGMERNLKLWSRSWTTFRSDWRPAWMQKADILNKSCCCNCYLLYSK